MLSSKTIQIAMKALIKEQESILYTPGSSESTPYSPYLAAREGIARHDEIEKAINELEIERQLALERENANKA